MKKLLQYLCVIFLVFGVSASLYALPVLDVGSKVGGIIAFEVYIGNDADPDPVIDYTDFVSPYHIDSVENVNLIIDKYNDVLPRLPLEPLPPAYQMSETEFDADLTSGIFSITAGTEYLSLKWGSFESDGGWFLWYVGDVDFGENPDITFSGLSRGLSHYREWGPSPVPEPATMMLFGLGLIGLAGIGRKTKK